MNDYQIWPSLLSANFAQLGKEAADVIAAGADALHLDVMDNHYVPNLTVGPLACEALRQYGIQAPIDVHLMTKPVDHLIKAFADAGASYISFHPEASEHIDRSLSLIKQHGCLAGLVFNPATPLCYLDFVMDKIDHIVIMSVNPGFGGQVFLPAALEKIRQTKTRILATKPSIRLIVDGGIKINNIADVAKAGADSFVAGSAIFHHAPYTKVIAAMRDILAGIR